MVYELIATIEPISGKMDYERIKVLRNNLRESFEGITQTFVTMRLSKPNYVNIKGSTEDPIGLLNYIVGNGYNIHQAGCIGK
jgi:hypothetical protein